MAWLRIDDSECLDPDVGELSPVEYQARHALLQYCARKHRDDGVFRDREAVHAVYATPKGARSVTRPQLARFVTLDLVRTLESYTDDELTALEIERPDGTGWLRPNNWERYNPPRDKTAAERQRRAKSRRDSRVSDTVTHGDTTVPRAQARVRVPVPSRTTEITKAVTSTEDVATSANSTPPPTNGPGEELNPETLQPTPVQLARWTAAHRSDPEHFAAQLAATVARGGPDAAAYLDTLITNLRSI